MGDYDIPGIKHKKKDHLDDFNFLHATFFIHESKLSK